MTDTVDTLLIDVRANTQGFAQDVATMRGSFDGQLVDAGVGGVDAAAPVDGLVVGSLRRRHQGRGHGEREGQHGGKGRGMDDGGLWLHGGAPGG